MKYKKGDFGYWWTRKNEDIEGGKYEGSICCPENLTSLRGAPRIVTGEFVCHRCRITTLRGAPEKVGGNFSCAETKLTDLKGA